MSKRNLFKTILFMVLISAMLVMSVGVAFAATYTVDQRWNYRYGETKVAVVRHYARMEVIGDSVRCISPYSWKTVGKMAPGWSWVDGTYPYCNPHTWTTSPAVSAFSGWFKEGIYWRCHAACVITCYADNGQLYCPDKVCACY